MRSPLLFLVLLASCASEPLQKTTPLAPTNDTPSPDSKAAAIVAESQPKKKQQQAWKTFIVDYSFSESGGTAGARGEVRLRSDGWFEVREAGKPLASLWLSAFELDSLTALLRETDWKAQTPMPSRSYKLKLSTPGEVYSLEGERTGGTKESNAAASMMEELRTKALAAKAPTLKTFSIEIIGESVGGVIPVTVSTEVSSSGAVSRGVQLGAKGTNIDGAQLFPLHEALGILDIKSLPDKLPEKESGSHIVHTTTVTITGDLNKTITRSAEGINGSVPLEPSLARLMREVMFIADRVVLGISGSSMQLTFSCSQYGASISTEEFQLDGATKSLRFSENKAAPTEKKLDEFMLSSMAAVLSSPQIKTLLRDTPKIGPEAPGVKKCSLSFTIDGEPSSVKFSSADQYSKASQEAISSLWSTLHWMMKN